MASAVSQFKAAGDFAVGDEIAADDGYLFTVTAIVARSRGLITVRLASDFSPMREIRAGVEKTFRVSSIFRVIPFAPIPECPPTLRTGQVPS